MLVGAREREKIDFGIAGICRQALEWSLVGSGRREREPQEIAGSERHGVILASLWEARPI